MANTDLIIPIVVAVIGLLGSLLGLLMSWKNAKDTGNLQEALATHQGNIQREFADYQKRLDHTHTVSNLTTKYGQPLLVAAYDLQRRLFELVEYPISRQALSKPEGVLDLKMFTCYLLAQYLAYVHILRVKVNYLSFDQSIELHKLRDILYMIDEELDRRRDEKGDNIGVWPASRILISERMLLKGDKETVNAALDGGLGVEVKGFDEFKREWDTEFFEPMGYFCDWIDLMLKGRICHVDWSEAPIRVLQHLVVDLIVFLDPHKAYIPSNPESLKCNKSNRGCHCQGKHCRKRSKLSDILKESQESRRNDPGLWPKDGLLPDNRPRDKRPNFRKEHYDLEAAKEMTYEVDLTWK